MTLAKAKAKAKPMTNKNIYSTGHWYLGVEQKNSGVRGGGLTDPC